jgi:GNAT superfamily N-acetyltransferase
MNWQKGEFTISTNKDKMNIAYIHHYLSSQSYWATNIPYDIVQKSVEGSLCFGVFSGEPQVGFARMVTDCATFGYLADVFIDEAFRGKGLSKWLMEVIMAHPELQGLRRILLATRDAHGLYQQFGFTSLSAPERWMQIHFPDRYKVDK